MAAGAEQAYQLRAGTAEGIAATLGPRTGKGQHDTGLELM